MSNPVQTIMGEKILVIVEAHRLSCQVFILLTNLHNLLILVLFSDIQEVC